MDKHITKNMNSVSFLAILYFDMESKLSNLIKIMKNCLP